MTASDSDLHDLVEQWRERMAAAPDAWTDVDLTFTQLRALFVLGRQPLRVSELAKALGMSLASASALSDRLVRQGLVARHPDPTDRRSVFLHVATAGARVLRRLERAQTSQLTRAVRQMNDGERKALVTTLRAFLRVVPATGSIARRKTASRGRV
jgi:DNA-binding MarR family transcriptional regulator